jgi:hypothetical protein
MHTVHAILFFKLAFTLLEQCSLLFAGGERLEINDKVKRQNLDTES